ncbi:heme-binding protein [Streptomyces sp. AJS327]|uniref:GlcG/HbpS family heme-binding protein n=1 Tax=Streptomyces sp. AJS327 TaxID=2545265 RepID=UPI0015DDA99E|nr:heme-binding protein [Streptomyces sp. AJS327]MBA0050966.1 heme-binding protein [Streptomyces sp. AJS327]
MRTPFNSPRRGRIVAGTAVGAVALAGLGGFGAVQATASDSTSAADRAAAPAKAGAGGDNVTSDRHLTVDAATTAARAALDAAERENQRVSVAVVGRDGNTIVTLRGDGAGPQSYVSAEKKAYTAVSWNAPTSQLVKNLEKTPNLKDIPGTLFLGGGTPVTAGDSPVAGIGVAGAPSGELDEKFARAGAEKLSE